MTAASGDPGETPPNGGVDPAFPAYGTPPDPAYGPPAGPAYGTPAGPGYGAPIGEPAPGYPGSYPPPPPPPGYAPPPAAPYGAPYPGGNSYPAGYPGYPGYPAYPAPPQTGTNTMAIVALISSVLGLLCGVGSLLGIGLGVVAISQIKKTGQRGHGLAVSAIVVGVASLVLSIIMWNYARHMS